MSSSLGCVESLKIVREALGVKVTDVAKRLGLTAATYYRFERGQRRMYFDQAVAVAAMMNVPVGMFARPITTDEALELHHRRLTDSEPKAGPVLILRPLMTEGGGLSAITRPYTDDELRQRNLDPAHYEPMIHTEHQPELEALAEAGRVMGADGQTDITELIEEWKDA